MTSEPLDQKQQHQEDQYEYPYHYIPELGDGKFSQTQPWSWGFRYLGGIRVVLNELEQLTFDSLVDLGCGDGRFLRELHQEYPKIETCGIDYSQRAINMANAMNPEINYECRDITQDPSPRKYDAGTLIEVLEHIPPADVDDFLDASRKLVTDDGTVIITVPHKNKPVNPKHHQHFTQTQLHDILSPYFESVNIKPFDDYASWFLRIFIFLIGNTGDHFLITDNRVMSFLWWMYVNRYLYTSENRCGRLLAVCNV
jgi:2-polyprenyl-3-methyl-5-hydroxy-6-metoxy-1,4-benzoquinol methylase